MDVGMFLGLIGTAVDMVQSRTEHRGPVVVGLPPDTDTAGNSVVEDLTVRVERLALVNMALWSFLSEKLSVDDAELMKRIEKIDLLDGKLDGKVRMPLSKCEGCKRVLSLRHRRCLYCGMERRSVGPFDEISDTARPGGRDEPKE